MKKWAAGNINSTDIPNKESERGIVYQNSLQVFGHKGTKTCRYIKAIYIRSIIVGKNTF